MEKLNLKKREIWKSIPGCNDKYQVSNLGRVRKGMSCYNHMKPYQIINVRKERRGYLVVDLYLEGKGRYKRKGVHQLMLMAFCRLPKPGEEARHLNDIKWDNRLSNLKWGTRGDNCRDFYRNGGVRGFNNPEVIKKCLMSRGLKCKD